MRCRSSISSSSSTKGLIAKGVDELSGTGSTEITTVLPLTSKGNISPAGAFKKKSSPGTGGPALYI